MYLRIIYLCICWIIKCFNSDLSSLGLWQSIVPCNENQLDALFILSLFRQSTSTCFGHVFSSSSGGMLCIFTNCWYMLWNSITTRTKESQLKSTTHTNCCIYIYIYIYIYIHTVYLLMLGYIYARNM